MCVCVCVCVCVWVAQLCLTLCEPMDCSPPGSSVHGILQARILEWVAIHVSRGGFQPRDQTQFSGTASRFFTVWATRSASITCSNDYYQCNSTLRKEKVFFGQVTFFLWDKWQLSCLWNGRLRRWFLKFLICLICR